MIARPLASLSLLFATPLVADANAPPGQPAKPAAAAEERVCETVTVTGSRLGKRRICATRAEWLERRRDDRETTDYFQKMTRSPCNSVNQEKGAGNC